MLISTGVGFCAEAAGLGCLVASLRSDKAWTRRNLTIDGAVLCLMVGPGSCVGGAFNGVMAQDAAHEP